jgi:hypothetical protein
MPAVDVTQPQRLGLARPIAMASVLIPRLAKSRPAKITLISLALSMPSNNTTVGRRPLPAPATK